MTGDILQGKRNTSSEGTAGFTLAELLVVVAIIAVLVAVAIPVFSSQLEKSREATDLANVRSAYAEVMTQAITASQGDDISKTVDLVQQQDGWQTAGSIDIGGITPDDSQRWIGTPRAGGKCRVYYSLALNSAVLDWNAGRNLWTSVAVRPGYWSATWINPNQPNANRVIDDDQAISTFDSESANGLYKLGPGKKYTITCTYDPHTKTSGGKTYGVLASATLLYDGDGYRKLDTGNTNYATTETKKTDSFGNEVSYKYTPNSDGTLTYTMTFTTPSDSSRYYLGTNFIVRNYADTSKNGYKLFTTLGMSQADKEALQQQIKNNFILEETR